MPDATLLEETTLETQFERRRAERATMRALAFVGAEDGRSVMLEVIDISPSGLRIKHQGPPLGVTERLHIEITVEGILLTIEGRVSNLSRDGAGIAFVDIAPADQALLVRYIDEHRHA